MGEFTENPILIALGVVLLCACLYYAAICVVARRFSKGKSEDDQANRDFAPPVSILKPVHGLTPGFYENIRSHAVQDYPQFELLFGVADLDDPAVESIQRLAREFPSVPVELVVCSTTTEGNAKVHCLEKLAAEARHETLLINDSDISVGSDYLRQVVAPLADPKVGIVTCLYRAKPGGTFWSQLEALWISAEFQAQVLLAHGLQGMKFGLGATMLLRRRSLDQIGGFQAIRPFLADDYVLGNRIASLGLRVVLSHYMVETVLPPGTALGVWRHLLRWSRTIRVLRPAGHAGLLVTQGTVWSLASLGFASGNPVLPALACFCLALRLAAGRWVGWGCLRSPLVRNRLYLLPLADLFGFLVWCGSFFGRRVYWGGRVFRLNQRGEILPPAGKVEAGRTSRALEAVDDPGTVQSP